MARHVPRARARRARRRTGRSTRSASPNQRGSTIVWDRATGEPVGPGLGWQDLRTVGACLALRAEGVRVGAEPVGHEGAVAARPARRPRRGPPTCASAPSTRGSRGRCRTARVHVTDATNAAVTGLQVDATPSAWDDARARRARRPGRDDAGDRRLGRRRRRGDARCPGAPPIAALARRPAGVARRPGLRAAAATPRSRSAPAACSTSCSASTPPRVRRSGASTARSRSSRGGTTGASRGASRRSCSRPARTCSGCATTSGSSRAPTSRTTSRRRAPTPAASCSSPRRSGSARPRGTTARAARCSASRAAPAAPRSCARCSKASRTAAPTSSTRPRPTAASRSRALRVDGGMTDNPTFVQALADATQRPVEISPVREATGARRRAAGRARGRPPRVGRRARHDVEAAGDGRAGAACSTATGGATPCDRSRQLDPRAVRDRLLASGGYRPTVASTIAASIFAARARRRTRAAACMPSTAAVAPTSAAGRLRAARPG